MSTHEEEHRDTSVSDEHAIAPENLEAPTSSTDASADGEELAPEEEEAALAHDESDEKKNKKLEADADLRSTLNDIRKFVDADDSPKHKIPHKVSLASILGGDILAGPWFRKQILYIVMCLAMGMVYISNRYTCQHKMIEQRNLNDTLLDMRYKALTRSAQLKERMRRSYIEESLQDTTLQTANTPSYNLKVEEQ